jgi:glutathione peroxidase
MQLRGLLLINLLFFVIPAHGRIPKNIYSFKVAAHNGGTIDFSKYKGKKILVVNTTAINNRNRQYAELEAAAQKYKGKLVIVGFLTDDFAMPPGKKRDTTTINKSYNVTFPLAAKVRVQGSGMAPVYKWLTEKKYNKLQDTEVSGDFQKFLINEKGKLVAVFATTEYITNPEVTAAIEKNE